MPYVAIDIESEPEAQRFSDRKIHAVGFAYENKSPICLPWNGSAQNKLKQLLQHGVTFVFHNAAYDVAVLRQKGIYIPKNSYEDTLIMSHTLCPSNARFHSLDAVAQRLGLPAKLDYRERLIENKLLDSKAKPGEEWWLPFNPVMVEYCSHDAWLTLQIFFKLQQELLSDYKVYNAYREYFLPFCECLMQLQKGVRIDRNKLFVYIAEIIKELEQYKAKLIDRFPIVPDMQFDREQRRFEPKHNPIKWVPFNPDSGYHRIWCLSKLGWEPTEWTETGLPKCGIDHLLDFSVNCEWTRNLIEYQKRASIISQCVQILEHSDDGYIRPRWHLCNTRTHRMSCSEPNLQNICSADRNPTSRFLRESFIPKPGHKFIVLDFQRIELVILAYLMDEAGDQRLADAIIAGKDPHQHNAEVWGCSRPDAKNGIFAVNYGASAPRLAQTIHCSLKHAQEIIDKINTNSPVISLLKQGLAQSMRCPGTTTVYDVHTQKWTNVGLVYDVYGSRYVYADIESKDFRLRSRAERQAFNVKMQGSVGSLICKLASKALPVLAKYHARYVLQVHDELVIEVPEHHTSNCFREVSDVFSSEYLGRIPIRISIGSGVNWADAKQ